MKQNRECRKRPQLSCLTYEKGNNTVLWVKYGFSINDAGSILCLFEKKYIVPVLIC